MKGDFSQWRPFDPAENFNGVLHQQGRVLLDTDWSEQTRIAAHWQDRAGKDVIGEGVAAVPASSPDGFKIETAQVATVDGIDRVKLGMCLGHAWADGLLVYLGGAPSTTVSRVATYLEPPIQSPVPAVSSIAVGVRDAVVLEIWRESLNAFQWPERLIEPALGGPDTTERIRTQIAFRLLRLGPGDDCQNIQGKLKDNPAAFGKLTVSLQPTAVVPGDCPVVEGGGYTGFEHHLYRIEIADVKTGGPKFKWSQFNGGLVGRGRFNAGSPSKVEITANLTTIVTSGLTSFYLEAVQFDTRLGEWRVTYGAMATLNNQQELDLGGPVFGAFPANANPEDTVFFRLWSGLEDIAGFAGTDPKQFRDGILLQFDPPIGKTYRPGDYWVFPVRAGEIKNPEVLLNAEPPQGSKYHRVPLAIVTWGAAKDTTLQHGGSIHDCRKRFRPLTNQKVCCTLLVGDGVNSFGDFNSLEEAAEHIPDDGGELCLLPGMHRANLVLDGRRNVSIHGCAHRTFVLPRSEHPKTPIISVRDCIGIRIHGLDLVSLEGIPILVQGRRSGTTRDICIRENRVIARVNAIWATNTADLEISNNRLHLLDTPEGRATISVAADDVLIERNTLVIVPFEKPSDQPADGDEPTKNPAHPCAKPERFYTDPELVLSYAAAVWKLETWFVAKLSYRAIGGIHVREGSDRVRILENVILGGAGNGITLGGELDPEIERAETSAPTTTFAVTAPAENVSGTPTDAAITVGDNGEVLALLQNEAGQPIANVDAYIEGQNLAYDRSDAQGMVSAKAEPGHNTLSVDPRYRISRIAESRSEGTLVYVVTVANATLDQERVRGFLTEITIRENDISSMGLSGIGFAARPGTTLGNPKAIIASSNDPKANILAGLDAAVMNLALVPLLRATDPVRDLVIRANRIHHCLQNPFTATMREEAQAIGRGGISLGVVESAVISENQVYENGPRVVDPVCGLFVGCGNDLEITDNVIAGNGTITDDYEGKRQPGLRGGIFVRFAGALTRRYSGHKPALRVHDNRVDHTAGRALTACLFGPASFANNHLSAGHTGHFQLLDVAVGGVLIVNLGGIHRLFARQYGPYLDTLNTTLGSPPTALRYRASTEQALPGGETLFDDNLVRLDTVNRSLTSQVLAVFDDLSYAANQASVFRGDPFFANTILLGDTLRVTDSRFREDATHTVSLLSAAIRMNLTAHNQADHCIVALPQAAGAANLPTIGTPNQVLDTKFCPKQFEKAFAGLVQFLVQVLAANANQLGGTVNEDTFTAEEVDRWSRAALSKSLATVGELRIAQQQVYEYETLRLEQKLGAEHPRVQALKDETERGATIIRQIEITADAATIRAPAPTDKTAAVSGRVANPKAQARENCTVELVRADGSKVETIGCTDATGYYAAAFDEAETAALAGERALFLRVTDAAGREVYRSKEALPIRPGANLQEAVTVPLRVVPQSVAATGTVIFETPTRPVVVGSGTPLERVRGIGPKTADKLRAAGIPDLKTLLRTDAAKLVEIAGFDADLVKREAKNILSGPEPSPPPRKTPKPKPAKPSNAAKKAKTQRNRRK